MLGVWGEVCTIWAIAGACVDLRLVGVGDGGFVVDVDDGFGDVVEGEEGALSSYGADGVGEAGLWIEGGVPACGKDDDVVEAVGNLPVVVVAFELGDGVKMVADVGVFEEGVDEGAGVEESCLLIAQLVVVVAEVLGVE